ncbi:MAG: hypothetical protein HXY50_12010 [Ignavibacteriaceae bacterium]|nr:hypothetical protein [Ignavibacteriaceae bacterium]
MTTLPPPGVNSAPENSIEKKVYAIVDKYKDHLPVVNDRYRLGFTLYKFVTGEGDPPEVLVKSTKIKLEGISEAEFAKKLSEELKSLQSAS